MKLFDAPTKYWLPTAVASALGYAAYANGLFDMETPMQMQSAPISGVGYKSVDIDDFTAKTTPTSVEYEAEKPYDLPPTDDQKRLQMRYMKWYFSDAGKAKRAAFGSAHD